MIRYSAHATSDWIETVEKKQSARHRLFCFPYAGGNSSSFRSWKSSILEDCEICSIRLPGRQQRIAEASFNRMKPLVAALISVLPLDLPFGFFGHSMGALVAFELAREMRRGSLPAPLCLFASASPAPQLVPNRPPRFHLSEADLLAEMRKLGGTPKEVYEDRELLDLVLPAIRADFAILDTYQYVSEPPLSTPISVLVAEKDREVDEVEALDWRSQTTGHFRSGVFPGDHFFIESSPLAVQQFIAKELERALQD